MNYLWQAKALACKRNGTTSDGDRKSWEEQGGISVYNKHFSNKKRWALLVLTLALALTTSVSVFADWTTFQGNNNNNGVVTSGPTTGTLSTGSLVLGSGGWVGVDTQPLIRQEGSNMFAYVFYTADKTYVAKVDITNAIAPSKVWDAIISNLADFQLSTPVIVGNDLYCATKETTVMKLTDISGSTAPTVSSMGDFGGGDYQFNTPLKSDGDNLYVGTWKSGGLGKYYKIPLNGNPITSYTPTGSTNGFYWAGAAFVGNYIVVGSESGTLYVLNKGNMTMKTSTTPSGISQIRSSITYDGATSDTGKLYFTDKGGKLWHYTIDVNSGDLGYQWAVPIAGTQQSTTTPVYISEGGAEYVYVASGQFNGGWLKCFEVTSSGATLKWGQETTAAQGGIQSSPVVYQASGGNYVYVTTNGSAGTGICFRENANKTGVTPTWTYPGGTGTYTLQGMAIDNGYAVFGNDHKKLYVVH